MKKILFVIFVAVILLSGLSMAAEKETPGVVRVQTGNGAVYDMEGDCRRTQRMSSMTVVTSASTTYWSDDTYGEAVGLLMAVETAAARCIWTGDSPTVTGANDVGFLFSSGDSYAIRGKGNVSRFKCINAVDSNGAVVRVLYCY